MAVRAKPRIGLLYVKPRQVLGQVVSCYWGLAEFQPYRLCTCSITVDSLPGCLDVDSCLADELVLFCALLLSQLITIRASGIPVCDSGLVGCDTNSVFLYVCI